MNKCSYCGTEARPGDNFCLNCGNRLLSATPLEDNATLSAQNNWVAPSQGMEAAPLPDNAPDDDRTVIGSAQAEATTRSDAPPNKPEKPARFSLRSNNGQEYLLDKWEITIGRAPERDISFPQDKLISRHHATVLYENGNYVLRDEGGTNGTFVNGQQLERKGSQVLQDGDHIVVGDQELVFYAPGTEDIEEPQTILIPSSTHLSYDTKADEEAAGDLSDSGRTKTWESFSAPSVPVAPGEEKPLDIPTPAPPEAPMAPEAEVTLSNFTSLPQLTLPDMASMDSLVAASTVLDGQIRSLQEQLQAAHEAVRSHEAELTETTNQFRDQMRQVSDLIKNTIADGARSRDELGWSKLLQILQDVMSNPDHIVYVQKFAHRASDVNAVFKLYEGVLKTLDECDSLLSRLIGEEKQ